MGKGPDGAAYGSTLSVAAAAQLVRAGGLVAFPTETYYGLAVDPFNDKALDRLFLLKRRATGKPVLVLIDSIEQLDMLASRVPAPLQVLIDAFWPGPLTIIFPAVPSLSPLVTAGSGTVGVRLSPEPVARELVRQVGRPITATSANLSGRQPATHPAEVCEQFATGLDGIVGKGTTPGGGASTVVSLVDGVITLVREGVLPSARLGAAAQAKGLAFSF